MKKMRLSKIIPLLIGVCIILFYGSDTVKAGTGAPVTVEKPEQYLQEKELCDVTFTYSADFSKIDFKELELSFYNENNGIYYRVPNDDVQKDVKTQLPAGTYILEYSYYDSYPNSNYETAIEPEKFTLNADGICNSAGDKIDFVLVDTSVTMQTVYLNDFNVTFDIFGQQNQKFDGSIRISLEGDTDTEVSSHETYQLEIDDIYSKKASIQMKAGRYRITKVDVRPADGQQWNVCYDSGNLDICHHKETDWKMAVYSDMNLLDMKYIEKMAEEDSDWKVTENVSSEKIKELGKSQVEVLESGKEIETEEAVSTEDMENPKLELVKHNRVLLPIIIIVSACVFIFYKKKR